MIPSKAERKLFDAIVARAAAEDLGKPDVLRIRQDRDELIRMLKDAWHAGRTPAEQVRDVLQMRRAGVSAELIGESLGLDPERVRKLTEGRKGGAQ